MQYHVSSDTKRRALVCVQKVLLGSKQTLDIILADFTAEKKLRLNVFHLVRLGHLNHILQIAEKPGNAIP